MSVTAVVVCCLLIAGSGPVLAAGDCADLADSALAEPRWYADQCASNVPQKPRAAAPSTVSRGPLSIAYAQELGFASHDFVSHTLNDFPGQTVLGTNAMTLFAYDFDPTATTLYALDNDTQQLGTVSLADGTFTTIGASIPLAGHDWTGLTVGKAGDFYASSSDGLESSLYTLDPATGAATLVGTDADVDLMIDISISCDGVLYGHDVASDSIYTIDPATGLATLVGATGVNSNFAQGMDFDNDTGKLYAWTYQGRGANIFGTIDLATGALAALATDDPAGEFEGAVQTTCQVVTRVGGEFQVNIYTTDSQGGPSVALNADGDFVVVWISEASGGTDSSGKSVQGQHYASDGTTVGRQFQVNTYTTNNQRRSSVALDADGDFVVVWDSWGSGGTNPPRFSVQGQRYASDGRAVGRQFQVNSFTPYGHFRPSVALDADGDFVVVWEGWGSPGTDWHYGSIQGQRFASDGTTVGGQFQVNTFGYREQELPSVALDADGDFVVVWKSFDPDWIYSIQGQRYAADGTPAGGEFRVNTYPTNYPSGASVALDADGDFVVVWDYWGSGGTDSSGWSVQGQRYASDGTTLGGQFQVNTYTTDFQGNASVALDADGDFVIVWGSDGSGGTDSSGWSVQGQRYASDGTTVGGEFQVNTYTTSSQLLASVALDAGGNSVVVWKSDGSSGTDTSRSSIQGRRFGDPCAGGACIFADGFESGDATAW